MTKKTNLCFAAALSVLAPAALLSTNSFATEGDPEITYPIPTGYTTFTDANFYNCVANEYHIANPSVDISNGLTDAQLASMTGTLQCSNMTIASAAGLEKITGINTLVLTNDGLSSVDLSGNTALISLSLANNNLTSIDLSHNTNLKTIGLNQNKLATINLSANTVLETLHIDFNKLNAIDLSANTALKSVYLQQNELEAIDLSTNTSLNFIQLSLNKIAEIDLSKNTELSGAYLGGNLIEEIDVPANTKLVEFDVSGNKLASLDVSKNTKLERLWASDNQLESIDVSALSDLSILYVHGNKLKSLDVSKNEELINLAADDILIKANISADEEVDDLVYDLSKLKFLQDWQTVVDTDCYTYNTENKKLTITNLAGTEGYFQLSVLEEAAIFPESEKVYTYKIEIPDYEEIAVPDTGASTKESSNSTSIISFILPIIASIVTAGVLARKDSQNHVKFD